MAKKWSRKVSHLFLSKIYSYLDDSNLNSRGLKLLSWGKWEELRELHLGMAKLIQAKIKLMMKELSFFMSFLSSKYCIWKTIKSHGKE